MKALSRSLLLVAVVLAGWAAPAFAIRGRSSPAAEDAAGLRRTTAGLKVLLFTSEECLWCRRMKTETLTDPRVLGLLQTMPLEEVDVNRQLAVAARYICQVRNPSKNVHEASNSMVSAGKASGISSVCGPK